MYGNTRYMYIHVHLYIEFIVNNTLCAVLNYRDRCVYT